jgi:hypothetical protein
MLNWRWQFDILTKSCGAPQSSSAISIGCPSLLVQFYHIAFPCRVRAAIVPQRRPVEQSAWRIILTSIAQTTSVVEAGGFLDDVDLAVPQLQKEGFTLKEIATKVAAPIPQSSTGSKP